MAKTAFRWLMIAAVITGFTASGWAQTPNSLIVKAMRSNVT